MITRRRVAYAGWLLVLNRLKPFCAVMDFCISFVNRRFVHTVSNDLFSVLAFYN